MKTWTRLKGWGIDTSAFRQAPIVYGLGCVDFQSTEQGSSPCGSAICQATLRISANTSYRSITDGDRRLLSFLGVSASSVVHKTYWSSTTLIQRKRVSTSRSIAVHVRCGLPKSLSVNCSVSRAINARPHQSNELMCTEPGGWFVTAGVSAMCVVSFVTLTAGNTNDAENKPSSSSGRTGDSQSSSRGSTPRGGTQCARTLLAGVPDCYSGCAGFDALGRSHSAVAEWH